MKAKTFENLLRKVVREEIDYALRREIKSLKEDLRDEIKPVIVEDSKPLTNSQFRNSSKNSLKTQIMGTAPIKQHQTQNFTSNSSLNDLLNETARGDTNMETANAPVSLSSPFSSGAPLPIETAGLPPSVANAMTRDYSDLMKAIDNKKR